MAKLKGLDLLAKHLDDLKAIAEQISENLDEKNEWMSDKSDTWLESENGQEWQTHLEEVEALLDAIDELEMPAS